jgi:hypothetical protein
MRLLDDDVWYELLQLLRRLGRAQAPVSSEYITISLSPYTPSNAG